MPYCIYLRKSRADAEAELRGEGETLARHEKALTDFAKYAKLPAPSCIYGCSYGYGDDRGEAYTMDDYDCIVAYFCLIKSQGFEYEEAGKTSKATLYNVYDDDGDFVAGCMMSELRSDPVLFITSSE